MYCTESHCVKACVGGRYSPCYAATRPAGQAGEPPGLLNAKRFWEIGAMQRIVLHCRESRLFNAKRRSKHAEHEFRDKELAPLLRPHFSAWGNIVGPSLLNQT